MPSSGTLSDRAMTKSTTWLTKAFDLVDVRFLLTKEVQEGGKGYPDLRQGGEG